MTRRPVVMLVTCGVEDKAGCGRISDGRGAAIVGELLAQPRSDAPGVSPETLSPTKASLVEAGN